jgi:lipopolysaccharide assembly protein A
MRLIVIFGILVAIGSVLFALQNNVPVTVTFLVWRFDSSLAMVLLLALSIGAIIVALVSTPAALRSRWTLARMRKDIANLRASKDELEAQIANLTRRTPAGTFTADSRGAVRDD